MATRVPFVCFSLPLALCLLLLVGTPQAAEKVKFGTPVKAAHYDLPFLAGEEKGYWKINDLEVRWIPFGSETSMWWSLGWGRIDVAMGSVISYVRGASRGLPAIIVADPKLSNDMSLWVNPDSPIKGVKELRGTKVGVPALGTPAHYFGMAATRALGIEKDVKFVKEGTAAASIAALKAGDIDAVIQDVFVMFPLQFKGEVRLLMALQEFLPKEWMDYGLYGQDDSVDDSPAAMRKAVRAFLQASAFVMDNPDWALAKLKASYGYSEDTARAVYNALKFSRDGKINPKALENVRTFLIEYGIVAKKKVPPLEELFTTKFVE